MEFRLRGNDAKCRTTDSLFAVKGLAFQGNGGMSNVPMDWAES